MYRDYAGTVSFWSNMSRRQAGIGLIVQKSFINQFKERSWEEIEAGRIAVLRLRGGKGGLDLWVCYLSATSTEERVSSIQTMSLYISPRAEVTSFVFGDYNFTIHEKDRLQKASGEWSGLSNRREGNQWNESMFQRHGLVEWQQELMTCETGLVYSRIDRIYCNQHVSDNLNRHFYAAALPPASPLSAHRPLQFAKLPMWERSYDNREKPLPVSLVADSAFARLVEEHFAMQLQGNVHANAYDRLGLLKRSMRRACCSIRCSNQFREVVSVDEQLEATLAFLRGLDQHAQRDNYRYFARYPYLRKLVDDTSVATTLWNLREHVVELSRTDIIGRIEDLQHGKHSMHDSEYQQKKEHLLRKLQRIMPGTQGGLDAMCSKDRQNITTDPARIADFLREHWSEVFEKKPVDLNALRSWTPFDTYSFSASGIATDDPRWALQQSHIRECIVKARESSPGPDGIPYGAWKKILDLASSVLFEVALTMQDSSCPPPAEFNLSFLCCLPKKPTGIQDGIGAYYDATQTRPLSLVNTDNRLIADAYRSVLEPLADKVVSFAQQGFIRGRSMLRNIFDIDLESMIASLTHRRAALILFDFAAAFPSVSQDLLLEVLRSLGMPQGMLVAISAFYQNTSCFIKFKGQIYEGFALTSGVRQGCPLSPVLFVLCADILLRRLEVLFPCSIARAFADDTAMVVHPGDLLETG